MRSGEEIRRALVAFAQRWHGYCGSERAEAQTFLNELFVCYGRDRRDAGAKFEDAHSSAGIMDLHLPGVAIVEMKAPSEAGRLDRHREQALNYWRGPLRSTWCCARSTGSRSGSRATTRRSRG